MRNFSLNRLRDVHLSPAMIRGAKPRSFALEGMADHADGEAAAATEQKQDAFPTFKSIAQWNLRQLRANPLGEVSGSLGDLGTLLPILIALAQIGAIDLASTLVFTGLASIVAGAWFGYPLAVQPMKAIAGIVLARGMGLRENMSAGLTTASIVAVFSIIGIQILINIIPFPVVRGIWLFINVVDLKEFKWVQALSSSSIQRRNCPHWAGIFKRITYTTQASHSFSIMPPQTLNDSHML
jgi:hypothetical protein